VIRVFRVLKQMVSDGVIEDYAVGGAIGAAFYIEAKATEDIDIFVHVRPELPLFRELDEIYTYLKNKGYEPKREFVVIGGWDVQFLVPAPNSIEDEAIQQANIIRFHNESVRVMMPEYLAAIALQIGREKDIDRVRAFIQQNKVNMDDLRVLVERFELEEPWRRVRMLL
jgi:hypothetical protein